VWEIYFAVLGAGRPEMPPYMRKPAPPSGARPSAPPKPSTPWARPRAKDGKHMAPKLHNRRCQWTRFPSNKHALIAPPKCAGVRGVAGQSKA